MFATKTDCPKRLSFRNGTRDSGEDPRLEVVFGVLLGLGRTNVCPDPKSEFQVCGGVKSSFYLGSGVLQVALKGNQKDCLV